MTHLQKSISEESVSTMRFSRHAVYPLDAPCISDGNMSCMKVLPPQMPTVQSEEILNQAMTEFHDGLDRGEGGGRLIWAEHQTCFGNDPSRHRSHPFVLAVLGGRKYALTSQTTTIRSPHREARIDYLPVIDRGCAICHIPSDGASPEFLHMVRNRNGEWRPTWLEGKPFASLILENQSQVNRSVAA